MFAVLTLLAVCGMAQEQIKWSSSVEHKGGDSYTLVISAKIADGWHLYDFGPYEGGPNPTVISFAAGEGVTLDGTTRIAAKTKTVYDDIYMMDITYFERKARFEQDVTLTGKGGEVKATVEYMVCNDMACIPPTEEEISFTVGDPHAAVADADADAAAAEPADAGVKTEAAPVKDSAGGGSLLSLIIEAILWGFAALLTPCVFPMVPMTVSFFMKSSGSVAAGRLNASLYGLFIVLLYTLPIAAIILITKFVGGDAVTADIFNWLATHWLPNIIFFVVFMVFAASFFGAFEITLPSWLVNKSDAKSESKGVGGIFFMALTLVLVSFSCTGPIVGSVLIKSTSGEFWSPIITMLAFSLAFALPFTLLAFFPSMMKKLPKSGGWLNSVKVVLGFVEVALGFKFLSVADQTYHWGLLDREVYLAIWIVVFAMMGLYLLGKIKFAHDSDVPYIGVGRLTLAIAVFSFVVYLVPGMWGAPLKALSGYLPPLTSQDFVLSPQGTVTTGGQANAGKAKYSDILHLPHGLEGYFDLKEAEAEAARVGKPVFIDFTGHGCVNCREMEARVWSDERVLSLLRNEYVIVALYTDDKMALPESEWVTTESGKVLKSLGKVNAHYALTRFGVNAQPYYVLQGRNGEVLNTPRGYDLDVDAFVKFLEEGVAAYNAAK